MRKTPATSEDAAKSNLTVDLDSRPETVAIAPGNAR